MRCDGGAVEELEIEEEKRPDSSCKRSIAQTGQDG